MEITGAERQIDDIRDIRTCTAESYAYE